jgi:hypothetical protein
MTKREAVPASAGKSPQGETAMATAWVEPRLAAILAVDVIGTLISSKKTKPERSRP